MIVTRQTLEVGAKKLGLRFTRNSRSEVLEDLIRSHMVSIDINFGRYACEGCGKDTSDNIPECYFCGANFLPSLEDKNVAEVEVTPEPIEISTWDDNLLSAEPTEIKKVTVKKESKVSSVEKPKKRKRGRPRKSPALKKVKFVSKAAKQLKKDQLESKREQIRQALPFTEDQLLQMKRTTILMVAGQVGVHHPIKIGTAKDIIKHILVAQNEIYKS